MGAGASRGAPRLRLLAADPSGWWLHRTTASVRRPGRYKVRAPGDGGRELTLAFSEEDPEHQGEGGVRGRSPRRSLERAKEVQHVLLVPLVEILEVVDDRVRLGPGTPVGLDGRQKVG